jgi:hypothetical protein
MRMTAGVEPEALAAAVPYSTNATIQMVSAAGHRRAVMNPARVLMFDVVASSNQKKITRIALAICSGQLIVKKTLMTATGSHQLANGSKKNGNRT